MDSSDWYNYNRQIYDTQYSNESLKLSKSQAAWNRQTIDLHLQVLRQHCTGKRVVDLGCGTGSYLIPLSEVAAEIVGVDFSGKMLSILASKIHSQNYRNILLLQANIAYQALASHSFDVAFSIATCYYVPEPEKALCEMSRVLRPDGTAIFELGNRWSLNAIASQHVPTGVKSFLLSVPDMIQAIDQAGFRIVQHRVFQLLPMWGKRPLWLKPLLWHGWKEILGRIINGRMIDEYISSFPVCRYVAFRHLFLCVKEADPWGNLKEL